MGIRPDDVAGLKAKHRALDTEISKLENRRSPADELEIRRKKQEKLRLKEQITRLESPPQAARSA